MRKKIKSPPSGSPWTLLLMSMAVLGFIGCQKTPQPTRLIDELSSENIVRSPLKEMRDHFESFTLELDKTDAFLYKNTHGPSKAWAVPIPLSICESYEFIHPEGVTISRNGEKLPFLADNQGQSPGWTWEEFNRTIQPEMIEEYRHMRHANTIDIPPEAVFHSEEIFLPKGKLNITLFMENPHPDEKGGNPKIMISLNGNPLREFSVSRKKRYQCTKNLAAGRYRLTIEHSGPNRDRSSSKKRIVFLDRIEISTAEKYILFTDPEFISHMKEYEIVISAFVGSNTERKLLKVQQGLESGDSISGENPFQIKKKLTLPKRSFNTLFAPPKSLYRFVVKVPDAGRLRFGLAMAENSWRDRGDGVIFNVYAEANEERELLFSRELDPYHKIRDRDIFHKVIDLSPYERREISLVFSTEPKAHSDNDLPFWVNPVIYSKVDNPHTNVILISVDTLRADHLSSYGFEKATSPNIDRIAEDGVLFKRCYSHSPSTLPSHMTMLTSLYPIHHKLFSNAWGADLKLNPKIPLLSDLLREQGYQTAAFTGGGWMQAKFGFSNGFDSYRENVKGSTDTPEQLYDQAHRWLESHRNMPFFLFLHTYETHGPYIPASPYDRMFHPKAIDWKGIKPSEIQEMRAGRIPLLTDEENSQLSALYDGEIRYVDDKFIAPLIAELKRLDLYEQTLIIFTSDHGEGFLEHGMLGHTNSLYDELLHVPLIIKFPDSKFRGTTIDSIVRDVDIAPTVLEILGVDTPRLGFDGHSLMPILSKPEKEPRISMGFRFIPSYDDHQRFVFNLSHLSGHYEDHKLILNRSAKPAAHPIPPIEFYNLREDLYEQINLRDLNPTLLRVLLKKVDPLLKESLEASHETFGEDYSDKNMEEQLRALGYIK